MRDEYELRVQQMLDRQEIHDALCRYARGVDRGDWELVRSTYHADAEDDHVEFKGDVGALIAWLSRRFDGVDNSTHFLGNCLIEFEGSNRAFVETYFSSSRLIADPATEVEPAGGGMRFRQSWGRYVDLFERRDGTWRVADRRVVLEGRFTTSVKDAQRVGRGLWGRRDHEDAVYLQRAEFL
jgi:hypothetical protein